MGKTTWSRAHGKVGLVKPGLGEKLVQKGELFMLAWDPDRNNKLCSQGDITRACPGRTVAKQPYRKVNLYRQSKDTFIGTGTKAVHTSGRRDGKWSPTHTKAHYACVAVFWTV